jgi:hypothetical protein
MNGSDRCLIEVISRNFQGGIEEHHESLNYSQLSGHEHLPNTCPDCFRYTNMLCNSPNDINMKIN